MMKVLCLNKISPVGLKVLPSSYTVTEDINEATAILVRSANMLETVLPENVLAVARAGAGVNNIPLEPYAKAGVVVFNTPGANANAVKELTIAAMLLAARDIRGSMEWVKENKGDELINKSMEKAKGAFAGTEILGKTLGVIGCGAIGALVAQAAGGLGMHVIGVEPSKDTIERNRHLFPSDMEIVSYDEMYARADYISIHVPLLDATRGMFNKEAFAKMKDGVIIINCARDAIVNDDDLKEALASGKVRKYVTDFPNYKTANMDGVVAISHLGASTEEAEDNCAMMAAKQVVDYVENGNIINSVNYPRLDLGKKEGTRVVVLYEAEAEKAVKEVVSKADATKLVCGVKGAFGATLAEVKGKVDEAALKAIAGVKRVRVI
ncbi:MAG: 3-phosphoglycerate dehydrogenase [Bacilli bacterium]|nr:3-phosphoglycerate dehydrogenase [Bacilli bacterium]MDY6362933.1 3-phosphoglycerate dehydrogenase [Bacilli bacterium]